MKATRHLRFGAGCAGALLTWAGLGLAEDSAPAGGGKSAEAPPSLVLSAALSPSYVFTQPANPANAPSYHRLGVFGELGVAYRSSYFIDPYLSVGYAALASGESQLPEGPWGEGGKLEQNLGAWTISPGVTAAIWRFRPRFALGLMIVDQSNRFAGAKNSVTQLSVSTQLGLGFNVLARGPLQLDVESRVVIASGVDVSFVCLGVSGSAEVLSL